MNETSIETKNAVLAGVEAAKQPKSSAILFQLLNKGAAAKLDVYDCSKISNAYICIRQNHSSMIWSVQDGEYVSCPTSLMIWIKNSKNMGIAVKSTGTSESQFILNNGKDFFFPEDSSIHGFVENQEYGVAFFFSHDKQVFTREENNEEGFSSLCTLLTLFMQDKDGSTVEEDENDYMEYSF